MCGIYAPQSSVSRPNMTTGHLVEHTCFTVSHEIKSAAVETTDTTRIVLAARVKALMEATGKTQQEIAVEADIDQSYVSKVVDGKMNATLDKIEAIARVFGARGIDLLRHADGETTGTRSPIGETIDVVEIARLRREYDRLKRDLLKFNQQFTHLLGKHHVTQGVAVEESVPAKKGRSRRTA